MGRSIATQQEDVGFVATYADNILKGTKPGSLPFEQATTSELVVSITTAKALGITIPKTLLLRADEVI
jgi:putative ABC transport system substrate-binding protein